MYYDPNSECFWALLPWVLVGIEGGVITSISQWVILAVLSALIASFLNSDNEFDEFDEDDNCEALYQSTLEHVIA